MSFIITISCPKHPAYQAKVRPDGDCKTCRLAFLVRNEIHKIISVPREERTDLNELIIRSVD